MRCGSNQARREQSVSTQERRKRLREHLRAEWIAGRRGGVVSGTGRPMTEELERLLRRYLGDIEA